MTDRGRATEVAACALFASLLAGCGGGGPSASIPPSLPAPPPTASLAATSVPGAPSTSPTMAVPSPATAAQVKSWQDAVVAFADRFNAQSADSAAAFAAFTDDARVLDPSNADFEIGPKSEIVTSWSDWMAGLESYQAKTIRTYVSNTAAVVLTDVAVVWPTGGSGGMPPLIHEARIFRFAGVPAASVTTFELWYRLDGLEAGPGTCFELHDCGPALRAFIDRYLKAWSTADTNGFAGLYADGATYTDGVLGIAASGPVGLAPLVGHRYGNGVAATCTLRNTYLVMNDGDPAVSDWDNPDGGKVGGILLATTCAVGAERHTVESAIVLMLGNLTPAGFDLDPQGRIVREEVFHDARSLVAAGLAD